MKNKNLWLPFFLLLIGGLFVINLPTCVRIIEEGNYNNASELTTVVNTELPEKFTGKYFFINLNGLIQKVIGNKCLNNVVKLNNGYLTTPDEKADVTVQAKQTIDFYNELTGMNIEFLYVQAPYLVDEENSTLPPGVEDYSNENASEYLKILNGENAPFVDLRKELRNKGLNHYDMFFKTDHHWKPEAAFYGYVCISEKLEEIFDVSFDDYREISEYEEEHYEKWFLGSNGKRTGIYYAGVDNFDVITPKSSSQSYSFEAPIDGIYRTGDFKSALMDYSLLDKRDYFGINCYHVYIGEEYPLVHITNPDALSDKKILLIKDSFALPVQAFLAQNFAKIDTIDLRLYTESTVMEYVRENKPDIVIVMYNPHMLLSADMFAFE